MCATSVPILPVSTWTVKNVFSNHLVKKQEILQAYYMLIGAPSYYTEISSVSDDSAYFIFLNTLLVTVESLWQQNIPALKKFGQVLNLSLNYHRNQHDKC